MFNIQESSFDIIPIPHESIHDLILEFWYQQVSQYTWSVVTRLKLGHIPLIVEQDFSRSHLSGGSRISCWGGTDPLGGAPTSDAYTFWQKCMQK